MLEKSLWAKSYICKWEKQIIAYIQNELGVEQQKELEEHFENCFECQKHLTISTQLIVELKALEESLTADLWAKLKNQKSIIGCLQLPIKTKSVQVWLNGLIINKDKFMIWSVYFGGTISKNHEFIPVLL